MSKEIPATTTEIAGVTEAAGQLGIATEDVLAFTRVMIDLGESTNLTADEAATSLAKFANITRTSADNYSRLGSVVVDLGNNFATTEAYIVAMSTRLASAGTISGLTEAEIMALAAAMSSVGIEAEAGGTAMAQTLNAIETAVATNSAELKEFARVAGVSATEFASAWESSPMVALQSFIEGLGSLDEKGESTVLVLDELGLTGIRQSNMLKSLGLAAETMGSSIDTANKAWSENTALTIEANKRYATTESQIKMMKNSYDNLKVSVGDVLVPSLKDLVGVSGEVMDGAADFVNQNPSLIKAGTATIGMLGTTATAITGVAAAMKVFQTLNLSTMLFNPFTAAIAGAAVLTGAVTGIVSEYNEAQEAARQYGDEVMAAAENYKQAMNEADELERNITEWKTLNATIASGAASADEVTAAKERLKETEQWLIDNYGIYMDNDGTISNEEIASLEARNEELRETARLKAEIELYDAKQNYEDAKESVGNKQEKRDKLSDEINELTKEQYILSKFSTRYDAVVKSKDYENASYDEQNNMRNEILNGLHAELQKIGIDDYYGDNPQNMYPQLERLESQIEKKREKENKLNKELLELSESRDEYINALNGIFDLEMSNIPTDDLKEFAEVAKFIGEQSAGAELETAALERYAEQLTEIAHAAGLLPENQSIIFNADGSLNVLEMIAGELTNLDGQSAEITVNANSDTATIKINDILYKVLEYDSSTAVATLSIDGKNATGQLDLVSGEMHTFNESEAEAYLNANTDDFDTNIKNAKEELNALDGKKVTVTTIFKSVYQTVKQALGFDGYATGTESAVPGAHWVGEHGPELLWFEGGEKVLDAQKSAALVQNHINASKNILTAHYAEPISAKMPANVSSMPIEIKNTFHIEGNATSETIDALNEFGDNLRQIIREEMEEAASDNRRIAYI